MFIGHFAVGLAAKSAKPEISLGSYFLAAQFPDLLWPMLLSAGVEHVAIEPGNTEVTPLNFLHYPISHSLLMTLAWSSITFLLYYLFKKDVKGSLLLAACVVSHWLLDFTSHGSDMPLTFSESSKVGLGLWNNKMLTILVESMLFAAGLFLYIKITRPKNKIGTYAFWTLIGSLAIIYIGNHVGPPPPNVSAIILTGHLQWLFILWAWWADRNRQSDSFSAETQRSGVN